MVNTKITWADAREQAELIRALQIAHAHESVIIDVHAACDRDCLVGILDDVTVEYEAGDFCGVEF